MRAAKAAVQFLLAWVAAGSIGCGPDAFIVIGPADGDAGAEASRDSQETSDAQNNIDAKPDVKPADDAASDSPSCDVGVQACVDAETLYCSRMKTCCNGACQFSWQNNGGAECMARFNNASCAGKMICETACTSDIQAASCTTVKNANGPASFSSSCMALY